MLFTLQPFLGEAPLFPHIPLPFSGPALGHRPGGDVSVYEQKDNVIVEAIVPGVDLKDVHVNYDKGVLSIQAEKKEEKTDKEKRYVYKSSSSFVHHLFVPGNIDEKIKPKIEMNRGIIKIIFTKKKTQGELASHPTTRSLPHKPIAKTSTKKKARK